MTVGELRRAERVKSLLKAKIVFNNRMTTVDCVVKNISATGARLVVNNIVSVPSEFDLEIPMKGKTYRAVMRWRDTENMGIEFLVAAEPRAFGSSQLHSLENENTRLKAAVALLSKRLEDLGQDVPTFF